MYRENARPGEAFFLWFFLCVARSDEAFLRFHCHHRHHRHNQLTHWVNRFWQGFAGALSRAK